jgi:DNA-binding XRE family transcriptional regulator
MAWSVPLSRSTLRVGGGSAFFVRHRSRTVTTIAPHLRFREARERLGLSPDEVASRSGVSSPSIWDLEEIEGELTSCYSPRDIQQLCRVLGIRPVELFADSIAESPVSAGELVQRIHTECRSRGVTLEQFEDAVGWRLSACIEPPEHLLEDMTVDGLQWLCRELRIDWRRVFLGL